MKIAFTLVLYFLTLFIPIVGLGENLYDQPYLGEFPEHLRDLYSAASLKKKASNNLTATVSQSDLIILAESESFEEAIGFSGGFTVYESKVKVLRIFKGDLTETSLTLNFVASATGIGKGSRHVLFLKRTKDSFSVLKASFVFPWGKGYDNYMRIFGAYDCSEDLGIDVIDYLANSKIAIDLEGRLEREYSSEDWGKRYCAVHFAAAASPAFGIRVLLQVASVKDKKRFDSDVFGTAAYSLAVQKNSNYWKLMLENVPSFPGRGRVEESTIFDLAANFGDEKTVYVIRDVVSQRPEFAVSAAFALSRIGGKNAKAVIESWLANEELAKREERISTGWTQRVTDFSTLFRQALEMKTYKQEYSILN
ncbi:MAG: hypothetical protein WBD22_04985 [Pyrinomonadaceae bacterium]